MNHWIRSATIAGLAVVLSGCVVAIGNEDFERDSRWQEIQRENSAAVERLELGMSVDEVRGRMPHPPEFSEAFVIEGVEYRTLFYRTRRVEADGETTVDETTPVIFADGRLDAWGREAWRSLIGDPSQTR
ncbi:MAG: DUF3192 domain-containing protein [Wenzhouxiangellaceae bacterium]|nr:DUF3192 domain-containing protein [Wenzhouxiangellaceae bacterium]